MAGRDLLADAPIPAVGGRDLLAEPESGTEKFAKGFVEEGASAAKGFAQTLLSGAQATLAPGSIAIPGTPLHEGAEGFKQAVSHPLETGTKVMSSIASRAAQGPEGWGSLSADAASLLVGGRGVTGVSRAARAADEAAGEASQAALRNAQRSQGLLAKDKIEGAHQNAVREAQEAERVAVADASRAAQEAKAKAQAQERGDVAVAGGREAKAVREAQERAQTATARQADIARGTISASRVGTARMEQRISRAAEQHSDLPVADTDEGALGADVRKSYLEKYSEALTEKKEDEGFGRFQQKAGELEDQGKAFTLTPGGIKFMGELEDVFKPPIAAGTTDFTKALRRSAARLHDALSGAVPKGAEAAEGSAEVRLPVNGDVLYEEYKALREMEHSKDPFGGVKPTERHRAKFLADRLETAMKEWVGEENWPNKAIKEANVKFNRFGSERAKKIIGREKIKYVRSDQSPFKHDAKGLEADTLGTVEGLKETSAILGEGETARLFDRYVSNKLNGLSAEKAAAWVSGNRGLLEAGGAYNKAFEYARSVAEHEANSKTLEVLASEQRKYVARVKAQVQGSIKIIKAERDTATKEAAATRAKEEKAALTRSKSEQAKADVTERQAVKEAGTTRALAEKQADKTRVKEQKKLERHMKEAQKMADTITGFLKGKSAKSAEAQFRAEIAPQLSGVLSPQQIGAIAAQIKTVEKGERAAESWAKIGKYIVYATGLGMGLKGMSYLYNVLP